MVEVRCEARAGPGQCPSDATVLRAYPPALRGEQAAYFALCESHRLLPKWQIQLDFPDPVKLYHSIHPRARQDGA